MMATLRSSILAALADRDVMFEQPSCNHPATFEPGDHSQIAAANANEFVAVFIFVVT